MSKITKKLFGGADQKQSSRTEFGVKSTPYSTFSGTQLNLDPSIRGLQEETLSGIRGITSGFSQGVNDVLGNFQRTRQSLEGNAGLFRQARLNPLQSSLTARRGELQRSIGQRGLGGSSFGEQSLTNFDTESQRAIGEASSLADADTLSAMTGIDKDTLNALIGKVTTEAQLYGLPANIAQQRLEQELQSFGLGKSQVSEGSANSRRGITQGFSDIFPKGY